MLGEERLAELRHALRPGEVGPTDEPAQAPVAGRVARQEDEVRAALRLADPTEVLPDGVAMARQSRPLRPWPGRYAVVDGPRRRGRSGRPARRAAAVLA